MQQTLAMYRFQFALLNIKLVATIKSKHQISVQFFLKTN